jgi:phosphoribosylformimino-5-aminoimidazole carboxamide ribotide isomerase
VGAVRIIPAIDLRAGRCVRLFQGDFDRETRYSEDPLAIARLFGGLEVSDLHVVDLDGAQTGAPANATVIRQIAGSTTLGIQLGGGLRERQLLDQWYEAGVTRCVLGSLAVSDPARVAAWLRHFGGDRIVLALDVIEDDDGTPRLAVEGWTRTTETVLWDCIDYYLGSGLRHVLCTDISRDGALCGPNLGLYRDILDRYPGLCLQASGGVRDAADLHALDAAGLPAVVTGRALLEGRISAVEVGAFRRSA